MPEKFHYNQYLNIRKAFLSAEYRGLESDEHEMKYEEFSKLLLAQKYITIKCKYPANFRVEEYRNRIAFIIFTRNDSEFFNRSKELITLLDKMSTGIQDKETISDLFLITAQALKKRTLKKVREYRHFNFSNILTVRFAIEIPKANLCNKHEIIPIDEVKKLIDECYIIVDRIKSLSEDDAQNIWIGGFPGEVVKITGPSLVAGYKMDYRYIMGVIAKSADDGIDEEEEDEDDSKENDDS